jgi:hypothetical protein
MEMEAAKVAAPFESTFPKGVGDIPGHISDYMDAYPWQSVVTEVRMWEHRPCSTIIYVSPPDDLSLGLGRFI